jgi:hypothetical protein
LEKQILFTAEEGNVLHQGNIVYVQRDDAFNFVPQQITNCSVLIGDLELCFLFDAHNLKRASQVWGFHAPPLQWRQQRLRPPEFFPGSLILLDTTIEEGDIVRLKGSEEWRTYYDPMTAWVCIGDMTWSKDDIAVEFATNSVAVIQGSQLKSLWLKPSVQ